MGTKQKQLMDAGGVSKLHLAVFQGKQEKVRKLLDRGSNDLNRGDKFGQTPLHIACHKEGLLGCLKLLAAHNADLEALDANGNTALHSAAGSGATSAAEFLLGRGLSVADRNKDDHTPMDICNKYCPEDKRRAMQALLEGGYMVEEEDRAAGTNAKVAGGETSATKLTTTVASGDGVVLNTVNNHKTRESFDDDKNPNSKNNSRNTSVTHNNTAEAVGTTAPSSGSGNIFSSNNSHSKSNTAVTTNNTHGNSVARKSRPIFSLSFSTAESPRSKAVAAGAAAARGEHDKQQRTVAATGNTAPLLTPGGGSATIAALSRGLSPKGEGAAAGRGDGGEGEGIFVSSTPRRRAKQASLQELHLAIFQGDTAKVEEVVARGDLAALNEADKHGQTPLHLACYKGSRVMTRLLVEGGANLNAVDVNGNGIVHAAVCDSPAVLAILIDNGADVTLPNHDGLTPKKLCEQYCPARLKERMLQLLKEATAAQAKEAARKRQLAEGQMSIEAVYHQLAMLRSRLAATAAARTEVSPSEAAEAAQTENALLTLVEANVRVVESQRHALEEMESTAGRLERMFRRLRMRLDAISPGDVAFS